MTSKISLVKLMKEEFRHHIVSIFATVLVFLAEILFFYFDIQRLLQYGYKEEYYVDVIAAAGEPSISKMIPVIGLAVLLAIEYFNYLHSQKKMDFHMSLPITRKEQFCLGVAVCGVIFIIPCVFAFGCECLIGYATGAGSIIFLQNMLWCLLCKLLSYMACFITMVLAIVMTGNFVIAVMGFGVFSIYVPGLLKWLTPSFESLFFDTYAGIYDFSDVWDYFSPISLVYGLTRDFENWTIGRHLNYMIAILIFIIVISLLTWILYLKRPSEAAGRAMAFQKVNSGIRFLIVVPLALYCGYLLQQTAPDEAIIWLYAGTIVASALLHGIIESIFQFDMRGMLSRKKQLGISALICCVFILGFQLDIMKYDEYVPNVQAVESAEIIPSADGISYYDNGYTERNAGIYKDTIQDVVALAEILAKENDQLIEDIRLQGEYQQEASVETGWITIKYQMKNGSTKSREYYLNMENEEAVDLLNKIVATEEFKNDYYALYNVDSEDIEKIVLDDGITVQTLLFSEEEQKEFLEVYLEDLTAQTITEIQERDIISKFAVTYSESAEIEYFMEDTYHIYENFEKTISFLEKYGVELNGPLADYEVTSLKVFEEYLGEDEGTKLGYTVEDPDALEEVKNELLLTDLYNEGYVTEAKDSRYAMIEVLINGRSTSYDVYVRTKTEEKLESVAQ